MRMAKRKRHAAGMACIAMLCVLVTLAAMIGLHHHGDADCTIEHCPVCCFIHMLRSLLSALVPVAFLSLLSALSTIGILNAAATRDAVPVTLISMKTRLNP